MFEIFKLQERIIWCPIFRHFVSISNWRPIQSRRWIHWVLRVFRNYWFRNICVKTHNIFSLRHILYFVMRAFANVERNKCVNWQDKQTKYWGNVSHKHYTYHRGHNKWHTKPKDNYIQPIACTINLWRSMFFPKRIKIFHQIILIKYFQYFYTMPCI
jgi:hypothetical protein